MKVQVYICFLLYCSTFDFCIKYTDKLILKTLLEYFIFCVIMVLLHIHIFILVLNYVIY